MVRTGTQVDPPGLSDELAGALERGELHLYYQPIVSLSDRSATKLEALARWDHPERGLLTPKDFIGEIVEGGKLPDLERWAVGEALDQLGRWTGGVPGQLSITINLSADHASAPGLIEMIASHSDEGQPSVRRLGMEIAESELSLTEEALDGLRALADHGVDITVDSFTGAVEPERLRDLPVSTLKLSPDVVAGVPDSDESCSVVSLALETARTLGLGVIATGIENHGQAAYLRDAGCRFGQGFLFSVPMPATALEERM